MVQSQGERWIDLFHRREKSEGTRIFGLVRHLATSHYVLNGNYKELHNLIMQYERDPYIWAIENRPKLQACQKEFLRLLHNYLASVYSLIEHTRKFCKELNNQELEEDYQTDLEKLIANNCVGFLKDLRTYTHHCRLPFVSATFSWKAQNGKKGKGIIRQKLILDKKDLLRWRSWSSKSKEYVEATEGEIDLKLTIGRYQGLIAAFYKCLYRRVIKSYSEQIKKFLEIESEMRTLQES